MDDDLNKAVRLFEAAGHKTLRDETGEPVIYETDDPDNLGYDEHPYITCTVCGLHRQIKECRSDSPEAITGPPPWRLNVGCGMDHLDDWINVDKEKESKADVLWDLEKPWPIASGTVSEIRAQHVLEHIGDLKTFCQEAYRVMLPGSLMHVVVPHHCHEFFWSDPTHVRPITFMMWSLLSRQACEKFIAAKAANTPLAIYWGVDFEVDKTEAVMSDGWKDKEMTMDQVAEAMNMFNNVVSEMRFEVRRV